MPHDGVAEDLVALIASRQSVAPKRLIAPGPNTNEVISIVAAAASAPDHGALGPFRVIEVAPAAREQLAKILVDAKRQRSPDAGAPELEREREKALNGPVLLVVCARLKEDVADIPVSEQLVSVGAAIENMLLAAHACGYGAILLSGAKTRDPLVRDAFALTDDEMLVGFVSIGTIDPSKQPAPKPRRAVQEYFSTWTGPRPPSAPTP